MKIACKWSSRQLSPNVSYANPKLFWNTHVSLLIILIIDSNLFKFSLLELFLQCFQALHFLFGLLSVMRHVHTAIISCKLRALTRLMCPALYMCLLRLHAVLSVGSSSGVETT